MCHFKIALNTVCRWYHVQLAINVSKDFNSLPKYQISFKYFKISKRYKRISITKPELCIFDINFWTKMSLSKLQYYNLRICGCFVYHHLCNHYRLPGVCYHKTFVHVFEICMCKFKMCSEKFCTFTISIYYIYYTNNDLLCECFFFCLSCDKSKSPFSIFSSAS